MSVRADLPSLGIVGYNGCLFGPTVDGNVVAEPVESECKRTIIYYVLKFHFEWYVSIEDVNLVITGVTNGANPTITTSTAHSLAPGAVIDIAGVVGATGVNGHWIVLATPSITTFTITTAAPGAYISGGSVVSANESSQPDYTDHNSTTDLQLETIYQQLMHPGADFQYSGSGMGYISVNDNPAVLNSIIAKQGKPKKLDPVWGPKPRKVTFRTLAGKAAKVSFDIDVAVLNCPDVLASKILMEFCYKIDWTITDGYTRRVYSGFLRIPGTRDPANMRVLQDNADKYLEKAMPTIPFGFVRKPIDRTLSFDKMRLDFRCTDEQWPSRNYPPPLCIKPQIRHTVETDTGMAAWSGSFAGDFFYELNTSAGEGFAALMQCIKDRLDNTKTYCASVNSVLCVPVIRRLALTELDGYGPNRSHYEVDYTFTLDPAKLTKSILPATGLFRPFPSAGHDAWATSMKKSGAWAPRGYAALYQRDDEDFVVDMCYSTTTPTTPTGVGTGGGKGTVNGGMKGSLDLLVPKLTPETSFMDYHLEFIVLPRHNTAELKPLPKNPVNYQGASVSVDSTDGYRSPYRGSNPSVIQMRNLPSYIVILRGKALRAGYSITPPEILLLAGQKPIPAPGNLDYYRTKVVSNNFVPIIFAEWQRAYILPDNPQQPLGAPTNPMWGGPTGGTGGGRKLEFITNK